MVTELAISGISAVVVPPLAAPLIAKVPGGALGAAAVGVGAIFLARKMDGTAKAIVVGAGAGLVGAALLSFIPNLTGGSPPATA